MDRRSIGGLIFALSLLGGLAIGYFSGGHASSGAIMGMGIGFVIMAILRLAIPEKEVKSSNERD